MCEFARHISNRGVFILSHPVILRSSSCLQVDYRTEDGTANAGSDYEFAEGTLLFKPGETLKGRQWKKCPPPGVYQHLEIPLTEITVGVIDDDIFEEDEYFYVHLSNPRLVGYPEISTSPLDAGSAPKAVLGDNHTATVTIYDDDHAGKFSSSPQFHVFTQTNLHEFGMWEEVL